MPITYLTKANNDVISHCECDDGRVTYPPQMDCPWCGCGWLFTCIGCRKAFTFAEGISLDCSWEEIARADILAGWKEEPSKEDSESWAEEMQTILEGVEVGQLYVILDGIVIPTDCEGAEVGGWYAHHSLDSLPQVDAITDPSVVDDILCNESYWAKNALMD